MYPRVGAGADSQRVVGLLLLLLQEGAEPAPGGCGLLGSLLCDFPRPDYPDSKAKTPKCQTGIPFKMLLLRPFPEIPRGVNFWGVLLLDFVWTDTDSIIICWPSNIFSFFWALRAM